MKSKREIYTTVAALFLFIILSIWVGLSNGPILGEDVVFRLLGGSSRNPLLLGISKILAFLGSAKFLIPAVSCSVIYGYVKKRRDFTLGILMSSLSVYIVNAIIKNLINRQRPVEYMLAVEKSLSFPSGHAMVNTALYLFIAFYLSKYVNKNKERLYYLVAGISATIMSLSRVYLGVHYPSDVLGGMLGGYIYFVGVKFAIAHIRR